MSMEEEFDPVVCQLQFDGKTINPENIVLIRDLRSSGMEDADIYTFMNEQLTAMAPPPSTSTPSPPAPEPTPPPPLPPLVPTKPPAEPAPRMPSPEDLPPRPSPSPSPSPKEDVEAPSQPTKAPIRRTKSNRVRRQNSIRRQRSIRRSDSTKSNRSAKDGVATTPADGTTDASASQGTSASTASTSPGATTTTTVTTDAPTEAKAGSDDDGWEEEEEWDAYSGNYDDDDEYTDVDDDDLFAEDQTINPSMAPFLDPEKDPNEFDKEVAFLPPLNELSALDALDATQTAAVRYVAESSNRLSQEAYPSLLTRVRGLGFTEENLKKTLQYIRDEAPIIVHFHTQRILPLLLKDTHYRNQFETNTSCGYLNNKVRIQWEDALFNKIYKAKYPGSKRVKYGVLNIVNDPMGVKSCSQYGDSYLVLKNARLRTSFANQDTGGGNVQLASCEYYCHVLTLYSDPELRAVIEVAIGRKLHCDSSCISSYKEIQIHGMLQLNRDVSAVVVNRSLKGNAGVESQLRRFGEKNRCAIYWMPAPST